MNEPNLSAGMKWLQGAYTQRFNSRHKVYGHLFQGRCKALNVADDDHYFERTPGDGATDAGNVCGTRSSRRQWWTAGQDATPPGKAEIVKCSSFVFFG